MLLLWRHRFITGSQGWEIPIGKIEPGEDAATAAAGETEEETGWRPGPLRFLLRVEPSSGLSDSAHSIYLASEAEPIGTPEDDFESDSVSWVPLGFPSPAGISVTARQQHAATVHQPCSLRVSCQIKGIP